MSNQISIEHAYLAMFRFLERHYERTRADEIGALLGGVALDADGMPMDPAAWSDWVDAVREVASPRRDAPRD